MNYIVPQWFFYKCGYGMKTDVQLNNQCEFSFLIKIIK